MGQRMIYNTKTRDVAISFASCRKVMCGGNTWVIPAQYYAIHTELAIGSISGKPDVFMTIYRDIDFGLLRLDTVFIESTLKKRKKE